MRNALILLLLTPFYAGCGGGSSEPSMLRSVGAAVGAISRHNCDSPVPSGSAEQVACHKAAAASCPEGTAPSRVDFVQETAGRYKGQFVVRGYECV